MLSLLIPTHNRVALLRQTLNSLNEMAVPPCVDVELIICANACNDDTAALIQPLLSAMPFAARCFEESTPGLSVARNGLLRQARGDLLAFLDDDVWVSRGWAVAMLDVLQRQPADMVTSKVDLWWQAVEKPRWLSRRAAHMLSCLDHGNSVCEIFSAGEALSNMTFRRRVLDSVHEFRSDLGRSGQRLVAGDDTDFIARALKAGHRLFYAPEALLLHWVGPERLTLGYLGRAAAGIGTGKVRMLGTMAPGRRLSLTVENTVKYLLYGGLEFVSWAVRYHKGRVNQHIRRMMCRGVLDALAETNGRAS